MPFVFMLCLGLLTHSLFISNIILHLSRGGQFVLSDCGVPAFPRWFSTTFLKFVVEVMTSGLPQVCKLWLWVSKGICKTSSSKNPQNHGSLLLWVPNNPKVGVYGTFLA